MKILVTISFAPLFAEENAKPKSLSPINNPPIDIAGPMNNLAGKSVDTKTASETNARDLSNSIETFFVKTMKDTLLSLRCLALAGITLCQVTTKSPNPVKNAKRKN